MDPINVKSRSRTKTISLYAQSLKSKSKTKTLKSKTRTPSQYSKSILNSKSPGISRVLRKRNAKFVSLPRVKELVERISFEKDFAPTLWNAVLSNKNICIYPKNISVIVQAAPSYTDYVPFNQATTPEDYNIFGDIIEDTAYEPVYLKIFEEAWYEDTSKFETQCKKDVIIFNIDLLGYNIVPGYPGTILFRHTCFLLVDKKKNKAYYIDSMDNKKEEKEDKIGQYIYTKNKMHHYICYKLEAWIYHILGIRMKVEVLDVEAPQTITNDRFCTNWAIMLADTIIRYYDSKGTIEPKKVIQLIRKKYNTKEKLDTLIRRYISYVKSIEEEQFPLPPPPPAPKKKTTWEKVKDYFNWF